MPTCDVLPELFVEGRDLPHRLDPSARVFTCFVLVPSRRIYTRF